MNHRIVESSPSVSVVSKALRQVGGATAFGIGVFCVAAACSESVASSTTSSALFPDALTSSPNETPSDGGPDQGTSERASNSVAPSDSTSRPDSDVASSWNDASSVLVDGGQGTQEFADARVPDPASPADAQACGIPVDNGPPLCDPVAQCGCNGTQTCAFTPDRVRTFTCVTPGATEIGASCDADDTCVKGSVCAAGLCAATCARDADCDAGKCVPVMDGDDFVNDLRVCDLTCDPLAPETCGPGATCANAPGTGTFSCLRQTVPGILDAACTESRGCAPGLGCSPAGTCRPWCLLDTFTSNTSHGESLSAVDGGAEVLVCPDYSECLAFNPSAALGLCGAACPVPNVPGSECSVIAGCGCGDGETCQVEENGRTTCNAPGQQSAMGWCNTNANCGPGLSCLGDLCRPVCDPELLACADGSGCAKTYTAESSPAGCLGHCDPVNPTLDDDEFTPCGSGAYCSPGLPTNVNLPESHCTRQSDTTVNDGSACTSDYQCRNGSGCDLQTGTCQHWCRETLDCNTGYTCSLNISPPRTGAVGDNLGFCRLAK